MENHLIIGLGGTGGSILREMRKRIYDEYRSNTPQRQNGVDANGKLRYDPFVNVEYLYVDSDENDLNKSQKEWQTQGVSVELLTGSKVNIHGINRSVLDDLNTYKGIGAFISATDRVLFNDLGTLIDDGIGGQRRRLGRLLFANNLSGDITNRFIEKVKSQVQNMIQNNPSRISTVTFHICAGMAGGTGSGTLIDAISQIRNAYNNPANYLIKLYLYVPEKIIVDKDTNKAGFYQANGYAALNELNAFSVGSYNPYDITGDIDTTTGKVKRITGEAFTVAYLFSNINEVLKQLDIHSELPKAVADFLFQKIVAGNVGGGRMRRLETAENIGLTPEKDETGNPVRSIRFMSFGIKTIEYPELEIKEYVANKFVLNAMKQVMYNTWANGIGYIDNVTTDSVGLNFSTEIPQDATLKRLWLSDDYLTLTTAMIVDDVTKFWKDSKSFWEIQGKAIQSNLIRIKDRKEHWLSDFNISFDELYQSGYRRNGVANFYLYQEEQLEAYAKHILDHIEAELFSYWLRGNKSLLEIEKYIDILISHCDKIIKSFSHKKTKKEADSQLALTNISHAHSEWNNRSSLIGLFTDTWFIKSFQKFVTAKTEYYVCQTDIKGYEYAEKLMPKITANLNSLLQGVKDLRTKFSDLFRFIDTKTNDCLDSGHSEAKTKKFDKNNIVTCTTNFITDEKEQAKCASAFRTKIAEQLTTGKNFSNLLSLINDFDKVSADFTAFCQVSADNIMADFAVKNPTNKMIGINIFDIIKRDYSTQASLKEFIKDIIGSAKPFLEFDNAEFAKILSTTPTKMLQLCLPGYYDVTYRANFINIFSQEAGSTIFNNQDVVTNDKENQIVIVSATSAFPLRFVDNIKTLKEKYDKKLLEHTAALNKMVLNTETFTKPLPSLFIKTKDEYKKEILPYVLIAYAIDDLVIEKTNNTTGVTYNAIGIPTSSGVNDWIDVGHNVLESVDNLADNPVDIQKIENFIDAKINKEYVHINKKNQLKEKLTKLLKDNILPLTGGEETNDSFVLYRNATSDIIDNRLK